MSRPALAAGRARHEHVRVRGTHSRGATIRRQLRLCAHQLHRHHQPALTRSPRSKCFELAQSCSHNHPYDHLREQLCEQRRRNRHCDGENISINMTFTIVTTSAATLDYGNVTEVAIVIVAMPVIADATDRAAHPAVRRTTAVVAASRLGVGFRIITDPVITFAMAATFVTKTNTSTVLNGSTAARVLRASVHHMTVAHVKERPGAPSLTFRNAMVIATSRLQRPTSMSLSHQRSQTTSSLHTQHRSVQWHASVCKPSPSSSSTSTLTQHDYLRPAHRQTCGPAQTPTR